MIRDNEVNLKYPDITAYWTIRSPSVALPDTPKCVVSLTECSVERYVVFFGKTTDCAMPWDVFKVQSLRFEVKG
jgi:hypothetical protein